jgi:hypothetical protein
MLAIFGIILVVVIIGLFDVPRLLEKKMWKELTIFLTLLLTGGVCGILQKLQVRIPSPVHWITVVYGPVSDAILHVLQ